MTFYILSWSCYLLGILISVVCKKWRTSICQNGPHFFFGGGWADPEYKAEIFLELRKSLDFWQLQICEFLICLVLLLSLQKNCTPLSFRHMQQHFPLELNILKVLGIFIPSRFIWIKKEFQIVLVLFRKRRLRSWGMSKRR